MVDYHKDYYNRNRIEIIKKNTLRQSKSDKFKEYHRKYYKDNSDRLKERRKEREYIKEKVENENLSNDEINIKEYYKLKNKQQKNRERYEKYKNKKSYPSKIEKTLTLIL